MPIRRINQPVSYRADCGVDEMKKCICPIIAIIAIIMTGAFVFAKLENQSRTCKQEYDAGMADATNEYNRLLKEAQNDND